MGIACMLFLCCSLNTNAQQTWQLETSISKNISAAIHIPNLSSLAFFAGTEGFYYSLKEGESFTSDLKSFNDFPSNWEEVTAAANWTESIVLLFNESDFTMMQFDEEGNISFSEVSTFSGLPENWGGRLDAVINLGGESLIFFAADQYVIYDMLEKTFNEVSLMTDFPGWDNQLENFDAVAAPGDGYLYYFGNQKSLAFDLEAWAFNSEAQNIKAQKSIGLPPGTNNKPKNIGLPPSQKKATPPIANNIKEENNTIEESKKTNTDGWCFVASPEGNSNADLVASEIFMLQNTEGSTLEDKLPQETRVKEIRVWGSWILSGIQTVLETAEGETLEMPIIGDKTGKPNVFVLDKDECITGIKGTYIGDAGNYIQTIKFITNKKSSKSFIKTRGKKRYEISIPNGTSFYGFTSKHEEYFTALGIKFVGFEGSFEEQVEEEIAANSSDESDSESDSDTASKNTSKKKNVGEWTDDMKDWLLEVQENQFFNTSEGAKPIQSSEWLGRGIDIIALDPVNISMINPRYRRSSPITLVLSNRVGGAKNTGLLYHGTDYDVSGSGIEQNNESWIESSSDWSATFGGSITTSVGSPVGGGGASYSFSQMNSTSIGSKEIYYSRSIKRTMFNMRLQDKWRDKKTGKKHRHLLDFDFRAMVDELPVISSVPKLNMKNLRKGKKLPAKIEKIKDQYMAIILKFGTHFSRNVSFGGNYISCTKVTQTDFIKSQETKVGFKQNIEAQIKAVTLGLDVAFDYESKNTSSKKSYRLNTTTFAQGASGEMVYDTWNTNLKENPVPIEVLLAPTYTLLSDIYFADDKDIKKKMALLRIITEQYQLDNEVPLQDPDGNFFDAASESAGQAPKRLVVTVTGIKCIRVDKAELGGDNEYYGTITGSFKGKSTNNAKTMTFWDVPEDYAAEDQVKRNGIVPINKEWVIDVAPGSNPNDKITITADLIEFENWPYKHPPLGKKSISVKLKDIRESGWTKSIKDFPNPWGGGDQQEVEITIRREEIMN